MGAVTNGTAAQGACDNGVDPQTVALDELIRIVPDQHPSFYYILASRLYAANRKDDAVFWFYAGQLRYRIRLACHPDLAPDTEPALFGSLQETVGRPVNEYGFGDLTALPAALERVLACGSRHRGTASSPRPPAPRRSPSSAGASASSSPRSAPMATTSAASGRRTGCPTGRGDARKFCHGDPRTSPFKIGAVLVFCGVLLTITLWGSHLGLETLNRAGAGCDGQSASASPC